MKKTYSSLGIWLGFIQKPSQIMSLSLLIGLFSISACTAVEKNQSSPVSTFKPSQSSSENTQIYLNKKLAFTLTLPSSWSLPIAEDHDPHFYESIECAKSDHILCRAFEIQSSDNSQEVESVFQLAASQNLKPQKRSDLISNTVIIETLPEPGVEGWDFEYHVFFLKEKRRFLIFSNDKSLEKDIFSTLMPIESSE